VPRVLRDRSLRTKLAVTFLVMTLLAVAIVAGVANRVLQQAMTRDVGARLHTLAQGRAAEIGDLLAQEVERLQTLALSKPLQDAVAAANASYRGDPAGINAQIAALDAKWVAARVGVEPLVQTKLFEGIATGISAYQAAFPDNVEVFVTDRYGAVVATTNQTSDYAQADEGWWQAANAGGQGAVSIGRPTYDDSSQTMSVTIAVPVYRTGTRELVGVLRSTYRLQPLVRLLAAARFGTGGDSDLLLADGWRFRSEGDLVATDAQTVARLRGMSAGAYLELPIDGASVLASSAPVLTSNSAAVAPVAQLGWLVVVDEPAAEALQPLNAATGVTFGTGVGALVLAGLLGAMVAQALSAPLGRVRRTAQLIAAGDLSQRVALQQGDEIGALAHSVNTMAEALASRLAAEQAARGEAERLQAAEAQQRLALEHSLAELRESIAVRDQLSATIRALSNPVLPIQEGLLVMPLIGVVDTARAALIVEGLLDAIAQHRARVVILDVTGIPVVDAEVAAALLRAAAAGRLLGCQTILAGIRPELAQTIVGLGIDFSYVETQADLQRGVAAAAERLRRSSGRAPGRIGAGQS
jgi:anti-anti-sigma regulatory factor/HAMP domain-containing protein